ncbi:hypothetical protein CQW23_10469 [Capsicum baccatum]|uniref:Uncharacterized protein n=1 Tax=Capsicum baccatum TaxID=33114 RepID=A0A2G2WZQ3_CAPBA|nr:hypothetical protein CQW23_10469 [Capsicum baccatum]
MAKDHSNDDEEFGEDLEVSSPGKIDTESESGEEMEVSSPGNIDTESESGEEMEVSSPGNITESESKSEPEQPPVATPKKPQPQDSSSSTEEEFDTDSEPDLDPKTQKPNSVVKPISSKPMDDPKKPRSEADIGQVEVVKVENVAATKGKKDSGGKDNWVLVEVKEEKQNAEVEKAVEFSPNLSLILCAESVATLEKWLEVSLPGNIDSESESGEEMEVSSPGNVAATKGKNDSGGRDNGVLVEVKEEKLSAEVEKAVEVKRNLNLIPCVENVAGLEKWLEENSGVLSVEKRNEMKEKWEALKVAEADLCLRRVNLIAEQVELFCELLILCSLISSLSLQSAYLSKLELVMDDLLFG